MTLDQLLIELQTEKMQLMRHALANPSDITRGEILAIDKIIGRIKDKRRAQLQVRLHLPFEK
ncbi:MAG: hypothetical protein ACRCZS_04660 [Chroococcidiopsis sp.]